MAHCFWEVTHVRFPSPRIRTITLSLKMANAWQKFVFLRMGILQSVQGPGMFALIPIIDNVVAVIDKRIQTTALNAEQVLSARSTIQARRQPNCPARSMRQLRSRESRMRRLHA